jgi:hypothetical protein
MSRRQASGLEVSTFPFLSILFALIGVLTLFLAGIVITRAIPDDKPPPPDPKELLAEIGAHGRDGTPSEVNEPRVAETEYRAYKEQIDALTKQLVHYTVQHERLAKLKVEAEAFIQGKEDEIAMATTGGGRVVLGKPLTGKTGVQMVPDHEGTTTFLKEPIAVEVKAEGFVVHPDKKTYAVADLDQAGSPMATFLTQVDRQRNGKYLLLLIRPNGVTTYEKLRKYLLKNLNETIRKDVIPGVMWREITKSRIDLGVEPFSDEWLLTESQQRGAE